MNTLGSASTLLNTLAIWASVIATVAGHIKNTQERDLGKPHSLLAWSDLRISITTDDLLLECFQDIKNINWMLGRTDIYAWQENAQLRRVSHPDLSQS